MDYLLLCVILVLLALVIVITANINLTTLGAFELLDDDFPYKYKSMRLKDVKKRFRNLRTYRFEIINKKYTIRNMPQLLPDQLLYEGTPCLIRNKSDDYHKYNLISDYFMDYCRMRARRYDQELSPHEYWTNNREIVQNYAKKHYNKVDDYALREAIYKLTSETTSFRPTIAVGFIKKFNAKKMLDISAGWGDRLIAALATGIEYCGVDPNTCLHPGYQKIIQTLGNKNSNVKMIMAPFEESDLGNSTFDLILTSPPYFNLENYTNEITQSVVGRDLESWFNEFLIASLQKAWLHLESGGHMVIIINDVRDGPRFTERMVKIFTDNNQNAHYLGVISYAEFHNNEPVSPQPCWIWKKE